MLIFQSALSMLESGENPNQFSDDGFTPICLASFWGKADIVKSLLSYGLAYFIIFLMMSASWYFSAQTDQLAVHFTEVNLVSATQSGR